MLFTSRGLHSSYKAATYMGVATSERDAVQLPALPAGYQSVGVDGARGGNKEKSSGERSYTEQLLGLQLSQNA